MSHPRTHLNHRLRILALIAAALTLPGMASGEDIDLYTGNPVNGGQPNVLLIMDNASNGNSATSILPGSNCPTWITSNPKSHDFEACALYNMIGSIGAPSSSLNGQVKMGLMMFNPADGGLFFYPNPSPTPPGPLPLLNTAGATTFQSAIAGTPGGGTGPGTAAVSTNSNNLDDSMEEAWAFFSGTKGLSGTTYTTPINDTCQKNFIIYLANVSGSNAPKTSNSVTLPQSTLATAMGVPASTKPMSPPMIPLNPAGYQQNWGDEWAKFMYQSDLSGIPASVAHNPQNIITYTIAVSDGCDATQQKCVDHINLVKSMAANGGGKYFYVRAGDVSALVKALITILTEVQATNSVFASVSLPVSVNAQGTSLNQVYVGMFRPDATAAPRWAGNLKQYQIGYDSSNNVVLDDSLGNPAISNAGTGFISPTALSYWTADHQTGTPGDGPFTVTASGYSSSIVANWPASGFWVNRPTGSGGAFDAPDGEVVDKGGVAEMIRADYLTDQSKRVIYTCTSVGGCPSSGTLPTFDDTTLAGSSLFGTSSTTTPTTTNLINWIRGTDNNTTTPGAESPAGPGTPVTVRPSIHGDVLHSRPAVVNYGGSIGIVAFYGSNDGLLRAVNGNKNATSPGVISMASGRLVRPGGELWSFIAPDFFNRFQRLYNNSPLLTLGSTSGSGKPYFFDGTTTVYQDLRVAGSPKTYIYVTARRGGRLIYAFDVSDPTKPPLFLWSKTNANIPELGQTWSQPKLALVKGHTDLSGNPIPVLVMGGGYDPAEDTDPVATADTMGRAIVVLDAFNGSTVWTACASGCTASVSGMTYAIPSDITLLDRNGDGYADRLYTGDLGGNIWRVDVDDSSPANWKVTKLASLGTTGTGTGASCATNPTGARKFFYPPDVTPTTSFDAVVAASGDREHPLASNASSCVVNRFYMLKDTNTGTSVATSWTTITQSMLTDETGAAAETTPPYSSTSTTSGFYVTLTHSGEKAVNAPLTVAGYTYFGTNTPADPKLNPGMCYPNLGIARGYAINFRTGEGQNSNGYIVFDGGGLPPSPVFGLVEVNPGSGVYTPVLIGGGNQTGTGGGNNSSALGAQRVTPPNTGKRKRTYWFTEGLK
ncbi:MULTISPECIES: pilus assembly protein [Rhodanobacter]|uniref:pilus assembly protein n=1 Tax=Rhodanobacter TaxID=75309 RepID=UPI0004261D3B|nr:MULTISPECIES: PilC/PilY family type IV pilus protein [Rhodanobacter]TAN16114.1 MAG: pilus assembly protein PilY [Rhodanobacter sp.]UJJ55780.1 pilus assembly protein PilY [Rhodanobacter thiooxydans]